MNAEDIKRKLPGDDVLPIGMRGTSYEMVVQLFEKGVLTGNSKKRRGGNFIYIWPVQENWEANGLTPPIPFGQNDWDPVEWSQRFARGHVERDYFEKRCGFPIGEYEEWRNCSDSTRRRVRCEMSQRGLTDSDIATLIRETKQRKGYILEFHPDLARDYKLRPDSWFGENHSIAFQINCPRGIGMKYVSKIIPIGKVDAQLMENYLRKRDF